MPAGSPSTSSAPARSTWPACSPRKLPEAEKLDVVEHRFEHGLPIIDGALAWAACELRELIAGGDHTIAIGEVIDLGLGGGDPLLWYAGRYHALPLAED